MITICRHDKVTVSFCLNQLWRQQSKPHFCHVDVFCAISRNVFSVIVSRKWCVSWCWSMRNINANNDFYFHFFFSWTPCVTSKQTILNSIVFTNETRSNKIQSVNIQGFLIIALKWSFGNRKSIRYHAKQKSLWISSIKMHDISS